MTRQCLFASVAVFALASVSASAAELSAANQARLIGNVDAYAARMSEVALQIWSMPELGYQETKTTALLQSELKKAGFRIDTGVAEIPTAFVARAGEWRLSNTQFAAIALTVAVTASGWVVRTAGLHYQMNLITFYDRNEWVFVNDWLVRQRSVPTTDAGKALVQQLREDALEHTTVNPYLLSPRLDQWFR